MKLNTLAFGFAAALLWGSAILLVSLAHAIWPPYGGAFLALVSSIYPGYQPGGAASIVVGTLYGMVDGGIAGCILAWLYNLLVPRFSRAA